MRFLYLKINFECYSKFFQITGTFFDFNLVLYMEGKKNIFALVYFPLEWRYIYETRILLLHRHNDDRLKRRSFVMPDFLKGDDEN